MPLDPETRDQLVETIARFVDERLIPREAEVADSDSMPADVVTEMREMGLFGLSIPEEDGGLGLSTEEEVLARLLFGRDVTKISAFQALQLASAVAALSGGGSGVVDRLRASFGFDDLDISTGEGGTTQVRVGRYLSEQVYSDAEIGSDGKGEISLNLSVTPSLTVKGRVNTEGDTGVGVFFERDY